MATPHVTLTHLAQQAAAQIGFTLRRWWRDKTDPSVLRVEVERRLVGARPAIANLTVAIPSEHTNRTNVLPFCQASGTSVVSPAHSTQSKELLRGGLLCPVSMRPPTHV
jgi:hypothetical protein